MKAYAAQNRRPNAERDRLIAEHLDIAKRIAARIARRCPQFIAREDLHAAAMLGLTEAAERYDSTRAEPFLGFAEKRIRGAILDELRRGDIMPRRTRQLARRIGQIIAQLEKDFARPPTDEEVAEALGVSLEEYKNELEQLVHVNVGSLDAEEGEGMVTSDGSSPETVAFKRETMAKVRSVLPKLDPRDVLVLSLYYNEELTYPEIGEVLKVTTSRVCQLHGRAIARLRAELESGVKEAA
jgi:RNA polymerase sigma factor for flagellar operon FliA